MIVPPNQKPGDPLVISEVKKGSVAHRFVTEYFLLNYVIGKNNVQIMALLIIRLIGLCPVELVQYKQETSYLP